MGHDNRLNQRSAMRYEVLAGVKRSHLLDGGPGTGDGRIWLIPLRLTQHLVHSYLDRLLLSTLSSKL
jgi:hypothetical protein